MPSVDATILCSTVLISFCISTAEKEVKKKTNCLSEEKTELKTFMICCLFIQIVGDVLCCNSILFYYALYESSATKLYRIGNISVVPFLVVVFISLSFVSFYCFAYASLWKAKKEENCSVRTMIIILWCCCWCNCCIKRSIFSAFIFSFNNESEKKRTKTF